MGARKNVRARGRHARGEGAPARKAPENRFNSHSVFHFGLYTILGLLSFVYFWFKAKLKQKKFTFE